MVCTAVVRLVSGELMRAEETEMGPYRIRRRVRIRGSGLTKRVIVIIYPGKRFKEGADQV